MTDKQARAYAKAMRPWYKRKRVIIPAALLTLGVAGAAMGGGDSKSGVETASTEKTSAAKPAIYPGRADVQKEDQEAQIGGEVKLSGYTATVTDASFLPQLSDFEKDGYIVATVKIANRDDKAQPYNLFDWKLQTPGGQVIDPTFSMQDDRVQSGDLIQGGSVDGKVTFKVGDAKGQYFIIYKPDPFDAARGVWGVKI